MPTGNNEMNRRAIVFRLRKLAIFPLTEKKEAQNEICDTNILIVLNKPNTLAKFKCLLCYLKRFGASRVMRIETGNKLLNREVKMKIVPHLFSLFLLKFADGDPRWSFGRTNNSMATRICSRRSMHSPRTN